MSVLQIRCPGCQVALRIPASAAGSKVRCSKCKKVLSIPARPTAATDRSTTAPSPAAATAKTPEKVAAPATSDPFGDFDSAPLAASASSPTPAQPASFAAPSGGSFVAAQTQQDKSTPKSKADRPAWLIPAIVGGGVMVVAMLAATGYAYFAYTGSVASAVADQRAAAAAAKSAAAAAVMEKMRATAVAHPLPESWTGQGARGVTVQMPANSIVREVASPLQGDLALRVEGLDPDSKATYWLTVVPLAPDTELARDRWLRNLYRYSGASAEEQTQITRGGNVGHRILLARDGKQTDPLIETFMFPDRMVVVSVQPANTQRGEAFFASLQLDVSSDNAGASSASALAAANSSGSTLDEASADNGSMEQQNATAAVPPTGAEARRKQIYLEYRRYAGANTTRKALPGINARDAVDRLMGEVNESQIQAFLVLHDLSEKQLGELITEGNNKNWAGQ